MKSRDISTIAGIALTTATLTLAVFWPSSISAGNDGSLAEKVPIPTLTLNGADITIRSIEGRVVVEGEEPVFELKAVNTSDLPVRVAVDIVMNAANMDRRMSRALPQSQSIWQQQEILSLKPHETKTITESTNTKLPPKSRMDVFLRETTPSLPGLIGMPGPGAILALSFATAPQQPPAETALQASH